MALVERLEKIGAIVCRGSRTDMAKAVLACVAAPTLLIVGERDETVLACNRESFAELGCEKQLEIVRPRRIFLKNPGTLEEVTRLAAEWFRRWLQRVAILRDARDVLHLGPVVGDIVSA